MFYSFIYHWIHDNLFADLSLTQFQSEVLGSTITLDIWLSHSITICLCILSLFLIINLFIGIFKFALNFFRV